MVEGFVGSTRIAVNARSAGHRRSAWLTTAATLLGMAAACAMASPTWAAESDPVLSADAGDASNADTGAAPEAQSWPVPWNLAVEINDTLRPASLTAVPWGTATEPTALSLHRSAHRLGDAGWYAYVNLAPSLPMRIRQLLGKPEGGLTLEPRAGQGQPNRLTMGSVLRWNVGDTGQMALRLRSGRVGVTYGTRFNL